MPTPTLPGKCFTCDGPPSYSVLLVNQEGRIYIPNQSVRRSKGTREEHPFLGETAFCTTCMRKVEDALRAQVLYLRTEADEERRLDELYGRG